MIPTGTKPFIQPGQLSVINTYEPDEELNEILPGDNDVSLTEAEIDNLSVESATDEEMTYEEEWLQTCLSHLKDLPMTKPENANIMQIQVKEWKTSDFPGQISGINILAPFDTGTGISCMSYGCYSRLPNRPNLNAALMLSVHLATGHDLCPMGIANCKVILSHMPVIHSFNVCKHLTKDLVIGLHMQQTCNIGCVGHWWSNVSTSRTECPQKCIRHWFYQTKIESSQ